MTVSLEWLSGFEWLSATPPDKWLSGFVLYNKATPQPLVLPALTSTSGFVGKLSL